MRPVVWIPLIAACSFPTETQPTPPTDTDTTVDTNAPPDTSPPIDTGNPTDSGATLDTSDTGLDALSWRLVLAGSRYGGGPSDSDSGADPGCQAVQEDLVTDQAGLDAFAQQHVVYADLTGTVDFSTEVAITGFIECAAAVFEVVVLDVR